jgi:hypothetical protein
VRGSVPVVGDLVASGHPRNGPFILGVVDYTGRHRILAEDGSLVGHQQADAIWPWVGDDQ